MISPSSTAMTSTRPAAPGWTKARPTGQTRAQRPGGEQDPVLAEPRDEPAGQP